METIMLRKSELLKKARQTSSDLDNIHLDFLVGGIGFHTVSSKIFLVNSIEDLLIDTLELKNYSDFVTCYTFIIHAATSYESKGRKYFAKKQHFLYNTAQLDLAKFEKATETEALTMQAEAYLEGILQIPTLRGMKKVAFDSQKFYQDCKILFENAGWVAR
jgi:hypothetical protein